MKSVQSIRTLIILVLISYAGVPVCISDANAGSFEKGSRRVSFVAGSGRTFSNNYFVIGLGAGHYIFDGLEIGLDGEAWLGSDPDIYKLSPQVKYILPTQSRIRPYIGTFYSHVFIDNYDDLDTIGGRGGIYLIQDKKWFIGVGAVYESYLNCDDTIYSTCDDFYPEITFVFSF